MQAGTWLSSCCAPKTSSTVGACRAPGRCATPSSCCPPEEAAAEAPREPRCFTRTAAARVKQHQHHSLNLLAAYVEEHRSNPAPAYWHLLLPASSKRSRHQANSAPPLLCPCPREAATSANSLPNCAHVRAHSEQNSLAHQHTHGWLVPVPATCVATRAGLGAVSGQPAAHVHASFRSSPASHAPSRANAHTAAPRLLPCIRGPDLAAPFPCHSLPLRLIAALVCVPTTPIAIQFDCSQRRA